MLPSRLLPLLAVLWACGRSFVGDPVVVSLAGESARLSEFERHVAELSARGVEPLPAAAREGLFQAWVERRLLLMEARSRRLIEDGASPAEEQEAVSRLLAREVGAPEVSEAEVDEHYRQHAEEFAVPETVALRQVLVPTLNEAREVQRRLRKDPKSFAVLAQNLSRGPEASAGGFMGRYARGELPTELEGPAFAVPPGQTSDIIRTPLGFHVLRVEERTAPRQESLAESRDRIRSALLAQKSERRVRDFVAGLLARAKVNHEAAKGRPSS